MRHAATASLFARRDVIIVASVSCIYGIGSPELYRKQMVLFKIGEWIERETLFRQLIAMQYQRNDTILTRGSFRVMGEALEIFPAYAESAYRINLFGDEIESVTHFDPLTGEILDEVAHVSVWPATHYVTEEETIERAVDEIRFELEERCKEFEEQGKDLEAHRLRQRTQYDLEMMKELGFCNGIENYSRILDNRPAGSAPHTLVDYFPSDFVTFVDESHQTMPQIGGMYEGDRSRKLTLVDHGFRLPSAIDNRPLKFDEFLDRVGQVVMVSATPGQLRAGQVDAGRRADRPPDRDRRPRGRGSGDEEPDRRPDERGPDPGRAQGALAGHDADQEDVGGPDRVPARARVPGPLPALRGRHDRADPDHPRPAAGRVRRPRRASTCCARASTSPRSASSRSSTPTRRGSCAGRPA